MGKVLVVRHGEGRGRLPGYMNDVLASVRQGPEAQGRVVLHHTGGGDPELDDVRGIIFWLADPLKEWYPACYAEACAIAEEATARKIRMVNPPSALSNSIKSRQSELWLAAGFDTPRWIRFHDRDELHDLARQVGFPAAVRSDEWHVQRALQMVENQTQLRSVNLSDRWLPGAIAPLFDVRHGASGTTSTSPYVRFHHKKRIYVLGDRVRTEHVFFSKSPFVSAPNCTFAKYDRRLPDTLHRLYLVPPLNRQTLREDVGYWRRIKEHEGMMIRAAGALGFDYAAIDYSEREDGSVVLWEANPHPYLPRHLLLPRLRLSDTRIKSYHRAIGEFILALAEGPDRAGAVTT